MFLTSAWKNLGNFLVKFSGQSCLSSNTLRDCCYQDRFLTERSHRSLSNRGYWGYLYLCKSVKKNPSINIKWHPILACLLRSFWQKASPENMGFEFQNALPKALLINQRKSWLKYNAFLRWSALGLLSMLSFSYNMWPEAVLSEIQGF